MRFLIIIYLGIFCFSNRLVFGSDWKNWLGPNYNGSIDGFKFATPLEGKNFIIKWNIQVGKGWSSPITYKNHVYFHDRVDGQEIVHCLNKDDGKEVWKYSYRSDYRDDFGMEDGPRSTPAIYNDILVSHGPQGMVHAISVESGKLIWKFDLKNELSSPKGFFGRCSSPLIVDDKVIFDVGGIKAGLIALSLKSGEILWVSEKYGNDYSSSVPYFLKDQSLCLSFVREGFLALDLQNGSRQFFAPFRSHINASVNAASPLVFENMVFLSSCYDVGAGVWEIKKNPELTSTIFTELWKEKGILDCHYATPIAKDGYLYGFHGRQEKKALLRCIRLNDGKMMWESTPLGSGNLIRSNSTIVIITENGELLLVKVDPNEYKLIHRQQILGFDTRAHFAISQGYLYARDKRRLICLNLKVLN